MLKGFTIIEVLVAILIIFTVALIVVPMSMENTIQANMVSKWTQKYNELQYIFSSIKAQNEDKTLSYQELEQILKTNLRVNGKASDKYKQYYMNKKEIELNSNYMSKNFYTTTNDEIFSINLLNTNCQKDEICAIMSFDLNGETMPNSWGYDIFGIAVYENGIKPLGANVGQKIAQIDCNKKNTGIYCSYYYLIGGNFE